MITNVSLVSVWVGDLDRALAFYTGTLGFEVGDDITFGPDFRWVTVVHPSQPELHLHLHLAIPGPPLSEEYVEVLRRTQAAGGVPGVGRNVGDCRATFEELSAKGVTFIQEPEDRPYGVEALMRDDSGNWLVLVERRPYDPEAMADAGSPHAT